MVLPIRQRAQDGVEDRVQVPADIFRQKPQHKIAVLLQQSVLAPVAAVDFGVGEMLCSVKLYRMTPLTGRRITRREKALSK